MDIGVVVKAISGFYYVQLGNKIWECSLRGRFRKEKKNVLVGDRVKIVPRDDKTAVVDEILPRETELTRPPVANVEQAIIVFALQDPKPNLGLLDHLLVIAEIENINPVICFNKTDLDNIEHIENIKEIYSGTGYPLLFTCAIKGQGIVALQEVLKDKISVFAGPSGVGKSTLLNYVQPGLGLKTGEVSEKIGRGRHTTRHTELLQLDFGGLVADSPGFSSLYLPEMKKEQMSAFFPEFAPFLGECKFTGCAHDKEPNCAVKKAVEQMDIHPQRYQHYLDFVKEVAQKDRRY